MKRIASRMSAVFAFSLLFLPFCAGRVQAQITFDILSANAAAFPQVSLVFEAKDQTGKAFTSYDPSEFTVIENGLPRNVRSVSCPPPITPEVSITFTFDISFSMSLDNRLANLKAASTRLVQSTSYPPAGSGITVFDDTSTIIQQYTSNKTAILNGISSLAATGGGTDFYGAFMDATSGAIDFTSGRPGDRYLIFMTDAFQALTPAQETSIINAARAQSIKVFTVTVSPFTVNLSLRRIATQTGGSWFEDVITANDADAIFKEIGDRIFLFPPCTLIYDTDGCDTERKVQVTLRKNNRSATDNITVNVNPLNIPTLVASPIFLDFGGVNGGSWKDLDVTLTARGGNITVQSATPTAVAYTVQSWGGGAPPFTLNNGQSRTIRIRFRPVNTDRVTALLSLKSNAFCQEDVSLSGGLYEPAPLHLIQPDGGETLFSGSTFQVQWEGIPTSNPAELQYSTNAGTSWTMITPNVYNLKYNWIVPNTPSDSCLGIVTTRDERISSLDDQRMPLQPAIVTDIAMTESGTLAAAALSNGQVKLYYPKSGELLRLFTAHASSVNAVHFSTDMTRLATASSDGRIRIWRTSDGSLEQEVTQGGTVHSVRFSRDGAYLATGNQNSVVLWKTADWSRAWTHNGNSSADGAVAISPRNSWVVSGDGSSLAILRFSDGSYLRGLNGHGGTVRSLDVSDGNTSIASGSDDRSIRIWNAISWQAVRALNGHNGAVRSVSFSNGGARVISASDDNTVRVWNVLNGSLLQTFTGHTNGVHAARYDYRSKIILSGGDDGLLRAWGYVPPLADMSDDLWKIVTTVISLDTRMPRFDTLACPGSMAEADAIVINIGNQPVTISKVEIVGPDAAFFEFGGGFSIPPSRVMQPEDTLVIPLRFLPPMSGTYNAIIRIHTDLPASPEVDSPISGLQDSVAVTLEPDTLHAGELYHCTVPVILPFVLTNTGNRIALVDSIASDNADMLDFGQYLPRILMPGQSDTLLVVVSPTADGTFMARVDLETTPCGVIQPLYVEGSRLSPKPLIRPSPLDLGFASVGDTATGVLWIVNPTDVPMDIDSADFSGAPFIFQQAPGLPATIPPHDSIMVRFGYVPETEGVSSGKFAVWSVAPCEDSVFVDILGSSLNKPEIDHSIGSFALLTCPDERSTDATVTLFNRGGQPLTVSDMHFEGTNPGDFAIIPAPALPLDILAGQNRVFVLRFSPRANTVRTAQLVVLSNALTEPELRIPVSGRKDSVGFTVLPASTDLGVVYHCGTGKSTVIRLISTGNVGTEIDFDTTSLPSHLRFVGATFPVTLAPGQTVSLTIDADPQADGAYADNLLFTETRCGQNATTEIRIRRESPDFTGGPALLDFGNLDPGDSGSLQATLYNRFDMPMVLSAINGEAAGGLTRQPPLTLPVTINPHDSLVLTYTWTPTGEDSLDASVSYVVNSPCPDTVTVSMHGTASAASARFRLADLEAEIGTRVVIPVRMDMSRNLDEKGVRSFSCDIVFNRTMLWPERVTSSSGNAVFTTQTVGDLLRVTITVTQPAPPGLGVHAELECLVMLGNDDSTGLSLENFQWLNGVASTTVLPGSFRALGICYEGGARLMAGSAAPQLLPNVPNPFNPSTTIRFMLPAEMHADLRVYNALGREIRALHSGLLPAGVHESLFDASGLPSGTYFTVLKTVEGISARKMTLMK